MTIWRDRATGRQHPGPALTSIPGRWSIEASGGNTLINNQPLLSGGVCFLVPDRRQNWSIIKEAGSTKDTGHFDISALPDAADLRALSQIAAAIDHSKTLTEYIAVSPLPTDLDDRTKSQAIDQQIRNRYIHLVHACRKPRQQLKTDLEKLPVGRAKRIPPRSLEYLASHSEDWKRKTVNGIEPTHVIAEIVEDQLNIYENRVAAELVDRIAIYLHQRVSELEKIKALLDDRSNFQSAFAQDAHFTLAARISNLWGANYRDTSIQNSTAELRDNLALVKRNIVGLKQSILYKNVPPKREIKQEIHHTNIFDNDPHYREVAELWRMWHESGESKEQDEEAIFSTWQKANQDFSSFCRLLACRALLEIGWKLQSADSDLTAASLWFLGPDGLKASLDELDGMTYSISTNGYTLKIVPLLATLARVPDDGQLLEWLQEFEESVDQTDTLFLYYGKSSECRNFTIENSHLGMLLDGFDRGKNTSLKKALFIPVSPFEITSLEKLGRHLNMLLRGPLLRQFPAKIKAPIPLAHYISLEKKAIQNRTRLDHWSLLGPIYSEDVVRIESLIAKLNLPTVQRQVGNVSENAKATLIDNVRRAEQLSSGVLTCPVCGQGQAKYQQQGDQGYSCACTSKSCGAEWGLRVCKSCHEPYPYLHPTKSPTDESLSAPGWLDRFQGRDCIAVPCTSQTESWSFVCSNCLACSSKPNNRTCLGCPAFHRHSTESSKASRNHK